MFEAILRYGKFQQFLKFKFHFVFLGVAWLFSEEFRRQTEHLDIYIEKLLFNQK